MNEGMNLRGRNRLRERKWNSIRWTAACQKPLHAAGNYNTGRQGAKALRGLSLRRRGRGLAGRGRNPSVIRVRRLDARLGGITTRSGAVSRPYGTVPDQVVLTPVSPVDTWSCRLPILLRLGRHRSDRSTSTWSTGTRVTALHVNQPPLIGTSPPRQ